MPLGSNRNSAASPADTRLSERATKALQSALGSGNRNHDIAPVKSRVGAMHRFTLPGDEQAGLGRMLATPAGEIKLWHQGLQRPWLSDPAFAPVEIGGDSGRGPTPGYRIGLKDFEALPPGALAKVRERPIQRPAQAAHRLRPQLDDEQVHALALQSLAAQGWDAQRSSGGITYLQDGEGKSAAGRLAVRDGVATCWSHRGEMALGDPWRQGRPISGGTPCLFATGRDLAGLGLSVAAPVIQHTQSQQIDESKKIASIQATWARIIEHAAPCPPEHRHLAKGVLAPAKALPAEGLSVIAEGRLQGAIAVPMLREADGVPGKLHIVGVQALLTQVGTEGNDKQLLAGSSLVGSFTPWPLPAVREGRYDLQEWVEGRDKSKPIVLCEGVATALAIHHSGAGHPVICYSSSNLPSIAKYFAQHGLDETHGIVVAADNDIGLKRDGSLKSTAVAKAIEAARECGGEVAFLGKSAPVDHDARDLFAAGGAAAVRGYIERAGKPDEVERRFERVIQDRREAIRKDAEVER